MTLKSLALRTKKSLSGLYTFAHVEQPPALPQTPKKSATPCMSTPEATPKSPDNFGLSPSSLGSPRTDSPSKRDRLRQSLRKMKSSFEVIRSKTSPPDVSFEKVPPKKPRPSLTLDFQFSTPGQAMFDSERNSRTSSSAAIHRSSPITVPSGKKSTPLNQASFPPGTVPESLGPLSKAAVQEHDLSPSPEFDDIHMASPSKGAPLPTPMPGTNLTLDEIQTPAIVVSSPSAPSMHRDGYFAGTTIRTVITSSEEDSVLISHVDGMANHDDEGAVDQKGKASHQGEIVDDRREDSFVLGQEDNVHIVASNSSQAVDSSEKAGTGRPVDQPINVDTEPHTVTSPIGANSDDESESEALNTDARNSLENKRDYVAVCLALGGTDTAYDGQRKLVRRRSAWGRHTGLYDGTGYPASDPIEDDRASQGTVARRSAHKSSDNMTADEQSTGPTTPNSGSVTDEKEALDRIIRAYAVYDEGKGRALSDASKEVVSNASEDVSHGHGTAADQTAREIERSERMLGMGVGVGV